MADLEANLLTYLKTVGGVTAIYGASPTRIYIDRIDKRITVAYPYAIIRTVTEAPDYAHDGALPDRTLVQIDTYSDSKTTASAGPAALVTALSGYAGAMGTMSDVNSYIEDTRGGWFPEARVFRRSLDVAINQNG